MLPCLVPSGSMGNVTKFSLIKSKEKSAGAVSENGLAFYSEMTEFLAYSFHLAS